MRRKILALFEALVLILSLSVTASAADTEFRINIPSEPVTAGSSFVITVELKNNPGFNALQFALSYDNAVLSCDYANVGSLLGREGMTITNKNHSSGAMLTSASLSAVEGDGIAAVIGFTAKKAGKTRLSLNVMSFTDADFRDYPYSTSEELLTVVSEKAADPEAPDETPGEEPGETPGETPGELPGTDDGTGTPGITPAPGGPTEPEGPTFTDTEGHWAVSYITRAVRLGLFHGYGNGKFGPNDNVTREQFVAVLYRMSGSPEISAETPFTDIGDRSEEFQSAIAWAYENGYVNGTSKTTFSPRDPITRESVAKILYLLNGADPGSSDAFRERFDRTYEDMSRVSDWAKDAVYWAVYSGMITGATNTTIVPQGTATRGQIAKILVSYYDRYGT